MACTNCGKPKITCGTIIPATCVEWEISDAELQAYVTGGSSTELIECTDLDTALEDIYNKLKDLEELTDFSEFESECLDLDDEPTLQTIITALDEKVCELSESVEGLDDVCNLLDKSIADCGLDYSCFETTTCEVAIGNTLKDLLQEMINRICALEA